jgi:EmrB/QacA subfamily drug resistance transporter
MQEESSNMVSKNVALFVTTLSSFLTTFMASSINIALPVIAKEFSVDAVELGWIATSYILAAAVFLVPFGKLADIYGRKKIYTAGIIVYTISSLLCAISQNEIMLTIARGLQGLGGSMIFGTAVAILTSVFPANERGKVLGYNLAATYLGLSLGPVIGGILTHQLGWRSVFFVSVILSCILVLFVVWKLKGEWAEAKGEKFDITGSIFYMAGLLGIMYGFIILPSLKGIILLSCGISIIIVFLYIQNKVKYPIFNVTKFKRNTVFIFSNLAAFINYSATFAVGYLLSLYLQYIKGFNPQDAGLIMVSQPITMAIFSPLAGRLSDKIEPQIVASIGMGLTVAGLVPFIFLTNDTSVIYIVATLLLIGVGFALFSSPNTNAIMSSVERKYYGLASASLGTMRLTGQTISMGIATLIFGMHLGRVKITPEYFPQFIDSTKITFIVFTILCTIGVFASLARGKLR